MIDRSSLNRPRNLILGTSHSSNTCGLNFWARDRQGAYASVVLKAPLWTSLTKPNKMILQMKWWEASKKYYVTCRLKLTRRSGITNARWDREVFWKWVFASWEIYNGLSIRVAPTSNQCCQRVLWNANIPEMAKPLRCTCFALLTL